mmetsp:Transcript_15931/g.32088  ORF Transcript_15931/g.32088 Transcript_15931/m.32088 type:complete len:112 (-) Transcript_15931:1279-1614(-)
MSVGLYVAMRISTLFSLEGEWKPATDKDIKPTLLRLCSCSLQTSTITILPPYLQRQEILLFTSLSIDQHNHPTAIAIFFQTIISFHPRLITAGFPSFIVTPRSLRPARAKK